MLTLLFPPRFDNAYRAYKPALWIFGLLLLMKTAIGFNSVFLGHFVASTADGIPLDSYGPAAAQTVVSLFALWGVAQLGFSLLSVLALLRYRTMVPLLFTLFLFDQLGRKLALQFLPIAKAGASSGSAVNLGILALTVIGLILSLRAPKPEARA